MKGTYITNQAKCVKVLEFDAVNKMAYTDFGEGDIHWVGEPEYKEWATPTYIPDIPAQIIEEPKIEKDAIQINTADEVDVCEQATYGEGMGEGNAEPEIIAEKSETKSEEKVKKTRKKKS